MESEKHCSSLTHFLVTHHTSINPINNSNQNDDNNNIGGGDVDDDDDDIF